MLSPQCLKDSAKDMITIRIPPWKLRLLSLSPKTVAIGRISSRLKRSSPLISSIFLREPQRVSWDRSLTPMIRGWWSRHPANNPNITRPLLVQAQVLPPNLISITTSIPLLRLPKRMVITMRRRLKSPSRLRDPVRAATNQDSITYLWMQEMKRTVKR